jgi:hypothetical protein
LALISKPTDAFNEQREKPMPVIAATDLKEHREVPSVRARLARVAALAEARRQGQETQA